MNKKNALALALGFFDGVHQGHAALLQKVLQHPATSAVLTFDRHPATMLGKKTVPLLSTVADRTWLFQKKYHIEEVIVGDFMEIHTMEWEDFIQIYLKEELNVTHVVAGHDFRFGRGGIGDDIKLQETCHKLGITCEIVPPVTLEDVVISSTHIRHLMETGDMCQANRFLGHPHTLSNEVQHGNKIGSTVLGFPTVNLSIPDAVIIPAFGVYACRIWVGDRVFLAVSNVGIRPTVTEDTEKKVTVEGFLLDFPQEDLYGQQIRVEFYHHLRGEIKFADFPALTQQIARDVEATKEFFAENPPMP